MAMLAAVTIDRYPAASAESPEAGEPVPTVHLTADSAGGNGHASVRCSLRTATGCEEWTIVGWVPFADEAPTCEPDPETWPLQVACAAPLRP
jgi:hypothetical protein